MDIFFIPNNISQSLMFIFANLFNKIIQQIKVLSFSLAELGTHLARQQIALMTNGFPTPFDH